jgi:hypothetical protein
MSDRIDTDAVLHSALLANHLEDPSHPINLEGDGWGAVREKQREESDPLNMLSDVVGEGQKEVLQHAALHHYFEKAAEALGWFPGLFVAAGKETIAKAFETIREGDDLNLGLRRDCAVGACLVLCGSALPAGFGEDLQSHFALPGELPAGAHRVYETILARPDGWDIRQGMVANCRDGQRYALDRHITTPAELAVALDQNREFADRYHHDLAFKLGADSVIWSQAKGQLPALEHQLPAAPVPATMEVRG